MIAALTAASGPPERRGLRRDQVRLLVGTTQGVRLQRFQELDRILQAGDLIVVNDSATVPAALEGRDPEGRPVLLHLSTRLAPGRWVAEVRERAWPTRVLLPEGVEVRPHGAYRGSARLRKIDFDPDEGYLKRWGRPIRYPYLKGATSLAEHQTIFARHPGSAEMPSAGRAFSPELVGRLRRRGVDLARITLHTGVASLENGEKPYPEWYEVSAEAAGQIARASRVIAVGTTVVRALETTGGAAGSGWTELVLGEGDRLRVVDDLISGFHPPDASHLRLLTAVVGRRRLERDYRSAARSGLLSHEFGDLHLMRGSHRALAGKTLLCGRSTNG